MKNQMNYIHYKGVFMNSEEKIKLIMKKSQMFFLENLEYKINLALRELAYFNLTNDLKYISEIQLFFHTVKGTAATLNLIKLSSIAGKFEEVSKNYKIKFHNKFIVSNIFLWIFNYDTRV